MCGVRVLDAEQVHGRWMILAFGDAFGVCPGCRKQSKHRHGWHQRHLHDVPAQGAGVTVTLRMRRWRCCNKACERQTFVDQPPEKRRTRWAPNSFSYLAMASAAGLANDLTSILHPPTHNVACSLLFLSRLAAEGDSDRYGHLLWRRIERSACANGFQCARIELRLAAACDDLQSFRPNLAAV